MKSISNKIALIILGVLIISLVSLFLMWKSERKERIRTESNQNALLFDIEHYKTSDSLNAVKIQSLELSKSELKKYESELVDKLKKQDIKIKRLESVTQIETNTKVEFITVVKDSLIQVAGKDSFIYIKCIDYKNPFIDFVGCKVSEDSVSVKIKIPVNLDIIAHRVPKHFLFIPHGVKSIDIDIISSNPYTEITAAKNIKLKK